MNWLTLFDIAWLLAVIIFLWLIWISSQKRLKHVNILEKMLMDVLAKDAESVRQIVSDLHVLVELLQKEPPK